MTKVYVKLYDGFVLTGSDFPPTNNRELRRLVFSPDSIHSISVVSLKDGTMLITNEGKTEFDFSISRNRRVLAVVRYRENAASLRKNNNWMLTQEAVQNRAISTNPDLVFSENLNIDFDGPALARIDMKINDSAHAAAFFTDRDLLFIRMNGNHVHPRLCEVIRSEASNMPATEAQVTEFMDNNPDFSNKLEKESFQRLVQATQWFTI